jgi:hypothetical protein
MGYILVTKVLPFKRNSYRYDTEDARLACVIDKAFVNLGAMMATRVDGKVSVEVDVSVHAARDAAAVVDKVGLYTLYAVDDA